MNIIAQLANKAFVRAKNVPENPISALRIDLDKPIFYITRLNSAADHAAITERCRVLGLPDPFSKVVFAGKSLPRLLSLDEPPSLLGEKHPTERIQSDAQALANFVIEHTDAEPQLIPITLCWGRNPGVETANVSTLLADSDAPSWLRKSLIVLTAGRHCLVRFSPPLQLSELYQQHSTREQLPKKLIRLARVHFTRQKRAATGPRLTERNQLFTTLLASEPLREAIANEAAEKNISYNEARARALKILDEIAGDYREAFVRLGERILRWLWRRLYSKIEVKNAGKVRELAEKGHEIVYLPCHRSHMDYLLLTYVIHQEGMVPPHIAAGINLSFWPAGPLFRKAGAFFIRRSFKGDKLYAEIFREYLVQLFRKGYSIKYYTEGGRSRTGLLLPPKTGMIAMTLQAMLRGIDRPVSIVPVYIGYEHVMEVGTYLKELAGSEKKSESVLGVLKAIKALRNYGRGYINFGDAISVNQFLNGYQSDWKDDIGQREKPSWLNSAVSDLADQVMRRINQAVSVNAVTLAATALLPADKQTLTRGEFLAQLGLYQQLLLKVPYSERQVIIKDRPEEMLTHLVGINKVEIISDSLGELITLPEKEKILMSYYRNNIVHTLAVPSLVAQFALNHQSFSREAVNAMIKQILPLLQDEWFMDVAEIDTYVSTVCDALLEMNLLQSHHDRLQHVNKHELSYFQLSLLASALAPTLQRIAICLEFLSQSQQVSHGHLEQQIEVLANRLVLQHGITAPEFQDKKVLGNLLQSLKRQGYVLATAEQSWQASESLSGLRKTVLQLLDSDVMQSVIRQSYHQ